MVLSILILCLFGFVFIGCIFVREKGVFLKMVVLGRFWYFIMIFVDGRYVNFYVVGNSIFICCNMDSYIVKYLWMSMFGI